MPTNANALQPSLVNELNELKRRLSAVERKPDVLAKFDRYPTTEWAAIERGRVAGNFWSSCGIANVTGLVYDRIECKFITDRFIVDRSEGELRLAAFRHFGTGQKECVSASRSFVIHGAATAIVGKGILRWVHGIPFGWDYEDGTSTYTIELQHRYVTDQTPDVPAVSQMFGFVKMSDQAADWPEALMTDGNGNWVPALKPDAGNGVPASGWADIADRDNAWNGAYGVSNMHYCVGLPEERIPEATPDGWAYYSGGTSEWGDAGNINDPVIG
ncbi:hypothetical protein [Streptomyces sp. NPDC059874]|uniref:hypothetical protein n=1 Tax=Streptomyces sp. NPDC059874 TaxID=3346983 RepID=UPI00364824C5